MPAPDSSDRPRTTGGDIALLVVAALAVATSSPLGKLADGLSWAGISAGRCGVAALAILFIAPRITVRSIGALGARSRLAMAGAGGLLALHFALFFGGLLRTSLPAAAALVSLEPLCVVLAGWIAFGIRPSRRELSGIVLAVGGAVVVALGPEEGEHRLVGDLMVVAATIVFGAYVMAARGLRDRLPVLPYAAAVYGVAFVMLVPFALMSGLPTPPAETWGVIVAMGLIPTLVGHTLIARLSRKVAPAVVALISPGETIGAIAINLALRHTWPSPHEWIGTGVVLAGATLAVTGSRAP